MMKWSVHSTSTFPTGSWSWSLDLPFLSHICNGPMIWSTLKQLPVASSVCKIPVLAICLWLSIMRVRVHILCVEKIAIISFLANTAHSSSNVVRKQRLIAMFPYLEVDSKLAVLLSMLYLLSYGTNILHIFGLPLVPGLPDPDLTHLKSSKCKLPSCAHGIIINVHIKQRRLLFQSGNTSCAMPCK